MLFLDNSPILFFQESQQDIFQEIIHGYLQKNKRLGFLLAFLKGLRKSLGLVKKFFTISSTNTSRRIGDISFRNSLRDSSISLSKDAFKESSMDYFRNCSMCSSMWPNSFRNLVWKFTKVSFRNFSSVLSEILIGIL